MQAAAARTPMLDARPSPLRVALVVALAQGVTDAYQSFVPPLLPRIMDQMGLSIALAVGLALHPGLDRIPDAARGVS